MPKAGSNRLDVKEGKRYKLRSQNKRYNKLHR
jgi:hypothetical protein